MIHTILYFTASCRLDDPGDTPWTVLQKLWFYPIYLCTQFLSILLQISILVFFFLGGGLIC